MTTTWLHVTTLMNWNRPPVGIVRVEREYARWLLDHVPAGEAARFCVYERGSARFIEVGRGDVEARLRRGHETEQAVAPPARAPLTGWKRAVKGAWTGGIKPLLPAAWHEPIARRVRWALHHLLDARRRWRERHAAEERAAAAAAVPSAPFARGDRFVSLGADWEYLGQQALYRLKRELGLAVTLICYDAIPVIRPQLFVDVLTRERFGSYLADLAWCADHVLCISECTRRDFEQVVREIGAPVPPTHVIRLGDEIHAPAQDGPPAGFDAQGRPFVLYVSTIERRKNHEILYRAWARMREAGTVPFRLVFAGMPGWGVAELMKDIRLDPRVQDDIVVLNRVDDAALAWLYRHAAFTVFPSLYEGWGLPVVESLGWGKFCLASNAASLPEAGGDWAEYIDPWDLPRWVERLSHYMANPGELQARTDRISREYRPTPWRETCEAIHRVAALPPVYSPGQS